MDDLCEILREIVLRIDQKLQLLRQNQIYNNLSISIVPVEYNLFEANAVIRIENEIDDIFSAIDTNPLKAYVIVIIELAKFLDCISLADRLYYLRITNSI